MGKPMPTPTGNSRDTPCFSEYGARGTAHALQGLVRLTSSRHSLLLIQPSGGTFSWTGSHPPKSSFHKNRDQFIIRHPSVASLHKFSPTLTPSRRCCRLGNC